jgi:DNA-binding transcriptional regulator YdaS (Cro superfamily)
MAARVSTPPEVASQAFQALKKRVSPSDIAHLLGITRQAVSGWYGIPAEHVKPISDFTGIPPHELRPDLYDPPPPPRRRRAAAA